MTGIDRTLGHIQARSILLGTQSASAHRAHHLSSSFSTETKRDVTDESSEPEFTARGHEVWWQKIDLYGQSPLNYVGRKMVLAWLEKADRKIMGGPSQQ